jgi:DNA-binding transcriptional LysR family regulator
MPRLPEDLLKHNCIRKLRGRSVIDVWHFIDEKGPRDIRVNGSLATDSGEVMHEWLLNGRGIGQKALWDIEDDLEQGRLIECLTGFTDDRLELCASFIGRPYLLPRTRVFVDFIADALSTHRRAKVVETAA